MVSEFKGRGGFDGVNRESTERSNQNERETKEWVETTYQAYAEGVVYRVFGELSYEPTPEEEAQAKLYITQFSEDTVNAVHAEDTLVLVDTLAIDRSSFTMYDYAYGLAQYGMEHKPSGIIHTASGSDMYDPAWGKMLKEHREFYVKEFIVELRAFFLLRNHLGWSKEQIMKEFEQDFLTNIYLELVGTYDHKDPQMRRLERELLPETKKRIEDMQKSRPVSDDEGGESIIRILDEEDNKRWENAVENMGLEKGQEYADRKKAEADGRIIDFAKSLSEDKVKRALNLHDILEKEDSSVVNILHRILNPETMPFFEKI
jgi:hypothetical protein